MWPALVLAAVCGCGGPQVIPVSPGRAPWGNEPPVAERAFVPVSVAMRTPGTVPGKQSRSTIPGADIISDMTAGDNYNFPVGEVVLSAFEQEMGRRYEGVTRVRKGTDYCVEVFVNSFELTHHGPGPVTCSMQVAAQIVDRNGASLARENGTAIEKSGFDGRTAPPAMWLAARQVAVDLVERLAPAIESEGVVVGARPLDQVVRDVSGRIATDLAGREGARLAVCPFDFDGKSGTPVGQHLADRIATALSAGGRAGVVERAQVERVLSEQQFQASGLVEAASASQIGRLLGVDTLVVGGCRDLGTHLELTVRWVEVETARVLGGEEAKIRRDTAVDTLVRRSH